MQNKPPRTPSDSLKESQGRLAWETLHTFSMDAWDASEAKHWFKHVWKPMIPNFASCKCREHFEGVLKSLPPCFLTLEDFRKWGWRAHNRVNSKLGKPTFTWADYQSTYKISPDP